MLAIIWEYRAKAERVAEFRRIYSAAGSWAQLFNKANGYLGTELWNDPENPLRFITIDRWVSGQAYEAFLSQWKVEYTALDTECRGLTDREFLSGNWELLPP